MKKIVSIAMTLAILVSAFMLPLQVSADSIEDTAQEIRSGQTVSGYFDHSSYHEEDYSINVSGRGKLSVNVSGDFGYVKVFVFDENGNSVYYSEAKATTGNADAWGISYNNVTEKFNGTIIYNVNNGTYYIRLIRGSTFNDNYGNGGNFKMTVTDSSAKSTSASSSKSSSSKSDTTSTAIMTVSVKKGSTLQLGASNASNTTWKTSSSKVATVSKGKVTAKAAGSATITATSGKTVLKIKVIVS